MKSTDFLNLTKTIKSISEDIDPADVGEYDREGEMAIDQLETAAEAANELRSILDADENLPEWVQSKITKALDYLDTSRDYMKSKDNDSDEETFEGDEFYEAYGIMCESLEALCKLPATAKYNSNTAHPSFAQHYPKTCLVDDHRQRDFTICPT